MEFGILEGFSLSCFLATRPSDCQIEAYDIFEEFPYHAANYSNITQKFSNYKHLKIEKLNFYDGYKRYSENEIDILHVDIANDGDVFEFVFKNYMDKISKKGICLIEGGSEERDNYYWMTKFNKRKIIPVINTYADKFNIMTITDFPSLTIVSPS